MKNLTRTCTVKLGSTVVSPYVGMARKQNGGYNASISVQTLIFHLVVNSTRLKTVRSALWRCPNSTVALRLLENVVKVTNLEVVKIQFRHLPIEVLRMGIFSGYFRLAAAMFEGSNVQWRLRKSAFRIAVQLRRQLYSKLFAYYKRTNTCVKIC